MRKEPRRGAAAPRSCRLQRRDDSDSSDEDEHRRRRRAARAHRGVGADYRESKGTSGRLTFRYKAKECGKCRNCLDKPKFGGSGKGKQACVLRLRERADLLESWNHAPAAGAPPGPQRTVHDLLLRRGEVDTVYGSDVCSHVFHRRVHRKLGAGMRGAATQRRHAARRAGVVSELQERHARRGGSCRAATTVRPTTKQRSRGGAMHELRCPLRLPWLPANHVAASFLSERLLGTPTR